MSFLGKVLSWSSKLCPSLCSYIPFIWFFFDIQRSLSCCIYSCLSNLLSRLVVLWQQDYFCFCMYCICNFLPNSTFTEGFSLLNVWPSDLSFYNHSTDVEFNLNEISASNSINIFWQPTMKGFQVWKVKKKI